MKKKNSKTKIIIYEKLMGVVKPLFEDYFSNYYAQNRTVKCYSFYEMEDLAGFSAVLEYDEFKQYINYYMGQGVFGENIVNTCFEFESKSQRFLCHFSDVLDAVDSDDLSFYTYNGCLTNTDIKSALDNITAATQKYFGDIVAVASSPKLTNQIFEIYASGDAYDEELVKVETVIDADYWLYASFDTDMQLKNHLEKLYKKGQLDEGFETRAYRVLNNLSPSQMKKAKKSKNKKSSVSIQTKIMIAVPYVIFAIVFAILTAAELYYIDGLIYSECVVRNHIYAAFIGLFLGAFTGVCVFSLFPPGVYKLLVKGEKYEEIEQVLYASAVNSAWGYVIVIGSCLFMWAFFICVFTFNGFGFTDDAIVYKEYTFSKKEVYSFESTDICEIKAIYSDGGYSEYTDTAYAFKLDDEWYEFGVPAYEEEEIILKNIEKYDKQIQSFYSIDDIKI